MSTLSITQVHIDALHTLTPEQGIELINLLFAHVNGQNVNVDDITDMGVRAFFIALKDKKQRGGQLGNKNAAKKMKNGN